MRILAVLEVLDLQELFVSFAVLSCLRWMVHYDL